MSLAGSLPIVLGDPRLLSKEQTGTDEELGRLAADNADKT